MKKWESIEDKINLALIKKQENFIKPLGSFFRELKIKVIDIVHNLYNSILPLLDKTKIPE